jgi:hypothetical protein
MTVTGVRVEVGQMVDPAVMVVPRRRVRRKNSTGDGDEIRSSGAKSMLRVS